MFLAMHACMDAAGSGCSDPRPLRACLPAFRPGRGPYAQKVEDRPAELRCTDAQSMLKLWNCVYNPDVSDERIKAATAK